MFRDRREAGERLADALEERGVSEDAVVFAIPRGAAVIGATIAERLDLPLDLVIVRKVGAPGNPEFAAGVVDPDGNVIENPSAGVDRAYLEREARRERDEIRRRLEAYRRGREEVDVRGRTALVVDDGVATGSTALGAVRYLRSRGAERVVLAVPVISAQAARRLEPDVDDLVALDVPEPFFAVGAFYREFDQVSDSEVQDIIGRHLG